MAVRRQEKRLEQTHPGLACESQGDEINAWYFTLVVLGIVAPGAVGGLVTQSVHGVVGGILWGGFARIFALDQATWAVNSLGHTIGGRAFPVRDGSRNIAALAPPTLGG